MFPFVCVEIEDDRRNNQIGIVSQPPPNKGLLLEVVLILVLSVGSGTPNKGPILEMVLKRSYVGSGTENKGPMLEVALKKSHFENVVLKRSPVESGTENKGPLFEVVLRSRVGSGTDQKLFQ